MTPATMAPGQWSWPLGKISQKSDPGLTWIEAVIFVYRTGLPGMTWIESRHSGPYRPQKLRKTDF